MKNINNNILLLAIVFLVVLGFLPYLASAAGILPPESGGGCDPTQTGRCGNYTLNDGVQLMVNVAHFILGIVGSLALLMFVIGGFMFLISAGNSKSVDKGKQIVIGAVIGLIIVFCSYMIIQFSMSALGLKWLGDSVAPQSSAVPANKRVVLQPENYSCRLNYQVGLGPSHRPFNTSVC
ncbi:hypothetical protein COT98_03300 [Candidatus Falkowbacteria bacterium CG10_big_fil_rev_8_21_14_0_10_39_9]|uniref:Uncharacterized protein n=1 Tax=Candidatus Falkowbacteria bacterium CG10_big_fil_rev_8_21_14_0_10_39_9 TaxID=1974566 RepID=A0A2M6WP17_9BACT|nr:MAG: hypothetical protein COT98_03300 [Candidatus Falkowbacteria bacterium CG10_big_fil_rev_8_21_14_0_10_39_9]